MMDITIKGLTGLRDRALKLHDDYVQNVKGMESDQALALMANSGELALGMLPTLAGVAGRLIPRPIAEAATDGRQVLIGYSDGRRDPVIAAYGTAPDDAGEIAGMTGWLSVDGETLYAVPDVFLPLPVMTSTG